MHHFQFDIITIEHTASCKTADAVYFIFYFFQPKMKQNESTTELLRVL